MAIKTTIVCTHCGEAFQVTMPTSGNGAGSFSAQHSPGCMKSTRVEYKNGSVVSTRRQR